MEERSCLSRRRERDPLLLASVGDVGDRGALHVARPAQVVKFRSPMQRAAIVPHDKIMHAPAVRVHKLPLRGVRE